MRKRSSSRSGKSVRWCAPRDSSRRSPDSSMVSPMSSMLASSRAASSSVLNDRLVSATPALPDPLLQLRERLHALGHGRPGPVDAGRVLHDRLHLLADGRDPLGARLPAHDVVLDAAYLVGRLGLDRGGAAPAVAAYSAAARAGPGAEHEALRQRVGAEPVRPVDADAGGLAGGVQALQRRRAVDVGVDATHHVVHDRADRDQLVHGVDPLVLQAQLAHEREFRLDELLAEMAQVEVDDRTPRAIRTCDPSRPRARTPATAGRAGRAPCS